MLMAYLNAVIPNTTQGCVVTLCCVKREMFLEKKELELSFLNTDSSDGTDKRTGVHFRTRPGGSRNERIKLFRVF